MRMLSVDDDPGYSPRPVRNTVTPTLPPPSTNTGSVMGFASDSYGSLQVGELPSIFANTSMGSAPIVTIGDTTEEEPTGFLQKIIAAIKALIAGRAND